MGGLSSENPLEERGVAGLMYRSQRVVSTEQCQKTIIRSTGTRDDTPALSIIFTSSPSDGFNSQQEKVEGDRADRMLEPVCI